MKTRKASARVAKGCYSCVFMPPTQPLVFKSNPVNSLTLQLEVLSPSGTCFAITAEPSMPTIRLRASVCEWDQKANQTANFEWKVKLEHYGAVCAHMQSFNSTRHEPISKKTTGGDWTIQFVSLRGGKLDIMVTTTGKGANGVPVILTVSSKDLRVVGTNPPIKDLSSAIPNNVLKQIARHESSLQQFLGSREGAGACPYFSEDNRGGVGIFQITTPRPTPDEIWNWRSNLAAGVRLFKEKQAAAKAYPKQCRASKRFEELVASFIKKCELDFIETKKKVNLKATPSDLIPPKFQVVLPEYSDDELYDDTIRAFNGFGGTDSLGVGPRLHEFEVPTMIRDSKQILDAELDSDGKTATLKWCRVPISRRIDGDPNYVANVKAQLLF